MFLNAGCSLLSSEGFCCSLDVLYGGLRITELQFFFQKIFKKFSAVIFFLFLVIKPWIWIRTRIRIETNMDPKHRLPVLWFSICY
jgi:hypothetical protein